MTEKKRKKRDTDWEKIYPHYKAGIRSLKDIGAEFGVSDAAIIKHADKFKWERDLKARIQAKAEAKVRLATIGEEVSTEVSANRKVSEDLVVDVEAQVQARIMMSHRKDVGRSRGLVMTLLAELESTTGSLELYDQLGEILMSPDDKTGVDKLNELYRKVISLPSRIDSMKKLADALKTLIAVEREAYHIAAPQEEDAGGGTTNIINTTTVFVGVPATSDFLGRIARPERGGRTLTQSVPAGSVLPAPVRAQTG